MRILHANIQLAVDDFFRSCERHCVCTVHSFSLYVSRLCFWTTAKKKNFVLINIVGVSLSQKCPQSPEHNLPKVISILEHIFQPWVSEVAMLMEIWSCLNISWILHKNATDNHWTIWVNLNDLQQEVMAVLDLNCWSSSPFQTLVEYRERNFKTNLN
jgi:hypothetical protein